MQQLDDLTISAVIKHGGDGIGSVKVIGETGQISLCQIKDFIIVCV